MGKRLTKANKQRKPKFLKTNHQEIPTDYNGKPPVFSFEKMPDKSGNSVNCCKKDDLAGLVKRIFMLNSMTWREIRQAPRTGCGVEKIPREAVEKPIPPSVTEDNDYFHALHYAGKKRFMGYKFQQIFIFYGLIIISQCMITALEIGWVFQICFIRKK